LLGRLQPAGVQLRVQRRRLFALGNLKRQNEATGLDNRAKVLETRFLTADLPARNLRALTPDALRQFCLRESRLQASFADDFCGRHFVVESTLALTPPRVADKLLAFQWGLTMLSCPSSS